MIIFERKLFGETIGNVPVGNLEKAPKKESVSEILKRAKDKFSKSIEESSSKFEEYKKAFDDYYERQVEANRKFKADLALSRLQRKKKLAKLKKAALITGAGILAVNGAYLAGRHMGYWGKKKRESNR